MATATRKAVRQQLATLLTAELVTAQSLVQAVYSYRIGDFQGQSPVVVVSSGGSQRIPLTFEGTKPTYQILVHVFVVYSTEDGTWTEEDAENALDDIEEAISGVIAANDALDNYWISLGVNGKSVADSVEIGGVEYRREIIELEVG